MSTKTFMIGLGGWIIQDGNYSDFRVGEERAFALEFSELEPLDLVHDRNNASAAGLSHVKASTYDVHGHVIHVGGAWWAIDAGVLMFQERPAPKLVRVGSQVRGRCYVGVDPFFYFERLALEADAPALIYRWRIERIERNATPWVEVRPRFFDRDWAQEKWSDAAKTDAWTDDNGRGDYVLRCTLLSTNPTKSRA